MCPKTITLQYNENTSRYDLKTYNLLTKFLKYGRISGSFNPIDNTLYKNICYLNSTRIKINTICCENFIKEHKLNTITVNFKYNSKNEKYNICKNMPVIATVNIKTLNIFNTMEFKIEDIDFDKKRFKINNEWYEQSQFSISFMIGFLIMFNSL